jgi:hypothetical protein
MNFKTCVALLFFLCLSPDSFGQNPINPRGDTLFITKMLLKDTISCYEHILNNGHYDSLQITDRVYIVMIFNTIEYYPQLYQQPYYLKFYNLIAKSFSFKLLKDLEFENFDRKAYYSEKFSLHYGGPNVKDRFMLIQ